MNVNFPSHLHLLDKLNAFPYKYSIKHDFIKYFEYKNIYQWSQWFFDHIWSNLMKNKENMIDNEALNIMKLNAHFRMQFRSVYVSISLRSIFHLIRNCLWPHENLWGKSCWRACHWCWYYFATSFIAFLCKREHHLWYIFAFLMATSQWMQMYVSPRYITCFYVLI